jgi:enediyne biosynthesis protein E4
MKKGLIISLLLSIAFACTKDHKMFEAHSGPHLGIDFQNSIVTNDTLNALTFEYIYNGGGVGVGDFNNDGLQDIFFGGNQVSSRLYLNKGNWKFDDITIQAQTATDRWVTGVSVIDINQDGKQDIYLCVAGKETDDMHNLLFINHGMSEGVPTFKESAATYGLDDTSYSTMAAFFDYDKDGDPDLYLVNNWLETFNRNNLRAKRINGEAPSTDKLFRNNGDKTFTDVSREAGILIEGYGLGINISDLNNDSWPDVYVSNDFMSNDLVWINQQDGTFKNMASVYLKHQTHNGMGIDIADFNNDLLADIVVVDMLPPGHIRQ